LFPAPPNTDEPVEAVCAASYYADRISAYAFVFRIPASGTRFTVYACEPGRYHINSTYTLTLSDPDPDRTPLWLSADETALLRHCLNQIESYWRDAIAEADAGAQRTPTEPQPSPGRLNVEPTPAGYRAIAERFRDQLHRVQQLRTHLDHDLPADQPGPHDPSGSAR
jgi:hypothetical protein